eukprot:CAMPEP_0175087784 /NCGR_PEP_ID=MMETSP0052_2-20121109/30025_1 /TAXON_ID=51329 ORGANISM="Polytomella parva, Strain SAG 63-3" /NCGR_SAMPLE_ID=MMETSP0052_2 /ASSEMBLY_ACC=CAM_ASM_000194 /LENGTH=633 /DNA_ID=CAMNT_0016360173 /DNA_START=323 /DNA_END=2224 /DNA_ORIENTATION=+
MGDYPKDKKQPGFTKSLTNFFKGLLRKSSTKDESLPPIRQSSITNQISSVSDEFKPVIKKKPSNPTTSLSPQASDSYSLDSFAEEPVFMGRSPAPQIASRVASMTRPSVNSVFNQLKAQASMIPYKGTLLLAVNKKLPPKMQRDTWSMKDYAIVEKLYKGYASTVYKAFCKRSGEVVCLKAYDMANLCELNRFQIYREVRLHSSLTHPNVINLYVAFQQDNQVVLVQEFADGSDLFTLLHLNGGRLSEKQAVEEVLIPFLNVLSHLHENGIMHRDVKPENVLFMRNMRLKLCDFGLAIDVKEERPVTRAGTLEYMAPEVLKCPFKNRPEENKERTNIHYDFGVDSWAVGVLVYELLVGFPPFNDKHRPNIEEKIRTVTPKFPSKMSEGAKSFISSTLQKESHLRPTIFELKEHPWVQSFRKTAPTAPSAPKMPYPVRVIPTSPDPKSSFDYGLDSPISALRPNMSIKQNQAMFQSFTAGKPVQTNIAIKAERHLDQPNSNSPRSPMAHNQLPPSPQEEFKPTPSHSSFILPPVKNRPVLNNINNIHYFPTPNHLGSSSPMGSHNNMISAAVTVAANSSVISTSSTNNNIGNRNISSRESTRDNPNVMTLQVSRVASVPSQPHPNFHQYSAHYQ